MPPVRWKLLPVFLLLWSQQIGQSTSSKMDAASMMEDGWRPIIGAATHREQSYNEEITHYRNPANKKSEAVKAEKPLKSALVSGETYGVPQLATTSRSTLSNAPPSQTYNLGAKIATHSKPMILMPAHSGHGPQIPLGPVRPTALKYGHMVKLHSQKRHKPLRVQMSAYSSRDEVFVPAPSTNIGPYTFYTPGTQSLKPRQPQPHLHLDLNNPYALQAQQDELYQLVRSPVQQYVIPKHPLQNDVHYTFQSPEDYNHNTPYKYLQEKEPIKHYKPKEPENIYTKAPGNLLLQVSPPTYQYNKKEPLVEITKEKINKYIPPSFSDYQPPQKPITYEVTEGKRWEEPQFQYHYSTRNPTIRRPPQPVITEQSQPFLPTPIKPDIAPPTAPTESEVSTIYNQIVQLNKLREQAIPQPTKQSYFSVKEVSTHFPVVGKPAYQQEYPTKLTITDEINEITTKTEQPIYNYEIIEETSTTTKIPSTTSRQPVRRRPNQRRRRPTTTTEAPIAESTEIYESQKTEPSIEEITIRARRPSRYRTTTAAYEEETTTRQRHRRPRPTTEAPHEETEVPSNHKVVYTETTYPTSEEEKDFPASFESHFQKTSEEETTEKPVNSKTYRNPPHRNRYHYDEEEAKVEEITAGTEALSGVSLHTPENEIDFTTRSYVSPTTLIIETTTPTTTTTTTTAAPTTTSTTTTTTTTEAPTTTRSHHIRGRPSKYNTGSNNRPRFSVKDYRQRMSTTTTTTQEPIARTPATELMRNRFPHRSRRPITTIGHPDVEEATESMRTKFTPKDPRHADQNTNTTSDKPFKPVNPRLRPFGRYKTTTEPATTTQKISIKPNIFTNLRRPTPISLKSRIMNKQRSTTTKPNEETTITPDSEEETNETDMSEIVESTIPYSVDASTTTTETIASGDEFVQSQIVSDLTSSVKNDYDKPGLFKNVAPTSRKVPSYFTLATDDPILPIEAFFPNLKQ